MKSKSKFIYTPAGAAGEYGNLAVNLFKGCTHSCVYCYAPRATYKKRESFHNEVLPRAGIIEGLKQEAPKYAGQEVFLCFSCDPYPEKDEEMLARKAIQILHANDVSVRILTKAGMRAARDFDLLSKRPELSSFGVTLTFDNPFDSVSWEPNAALPDERIESLRRAKALGIPTWASMEPVIYPEQTLNLIEATKDFVDMYKIGKWNHDKRAKEINWPVFAREAVALCEELGKEYYIKNDLAAFLGIDEASIFSR